PVHHRRGHHRLVPGAGGPERHAGQRHRGCAGPCPGGPAGPGVGLDRPPADGRRGAGRGAGDRCRHRQRRPPADPRPACSPAPSAPTPRPPPRPRSARPPFAWRAFARSFWLSPRRYPDFAWAWLTRFAVNLGNAMALLYLLYFLRDKIHYGQLFPGQKAENGLLILILIYTVAVVLTAVTGGGVSDRPRPGRGRLPVSVSGLVMAVPAVMLALWPSWPVAIASAAIIGLGFGVYLSVDQALVTQVLPSAAGRAKDLGIINIANSGPQVLAPAIAAPLVSRLGGDPAPFLSLALVTGLRAAVRWEVRSVPRPPPCPRRHTQ